MESQEIDFLLDKINGPIKHVVVAENEVKGQINSSRKPLIVIGNTDPSWLPGKHWIAFYFPLKLSPEFFDSYGHSPEFYSVDFKSFLLTNNDTGYYKYNQWQIQSSNSNVCGLYCILYALRKYQNIPFEVFVKDFGSDNLQNNDEKCIYLVESRFNVRLNVQKNNLIQ